MRLTFHPSEALVLTLALGLAALLGEGVCPRTALVQGELFVANIANDSITVYGRTASGNTAPTHTLAGVAAELSGPAFIAVTTGTTTTIGLYRPSTNTFYLRNSNTFGAPDLIIPFGAPNDLPVVGNWDGGP